MLAIIGGSGLDSLAQFVVLKQHSVDTPYQRPSANICQGSFSDDGSTLSGDSFVFFLPRHDAGHSIAPHKINYRANIWALKSLGVTHIVSVCAVGGIKEPFLDGALSVPDQLIDYTWGRAHTFFDQEGDVQHAPFADPFSEQVRTLIKQSAQRVGQHVVDGGVYGVTQGPRLETKAEIQRMKQDGCDMVGMTLMPEAALAAELGMHYACLCFTVNPAAGVVEQELTMDEIYAQLAQCAPKVNTVLRECADGFLSI